jgi:hypothetical protein
MTGDDVETRAMALWVAAADAAVKGGEQPPVEGWDVQDDEVKQHYRVLAGGIEKARLRDPASPP